MSGTLPELQVDAALADLVEDALAGVNLSAREFWRGVADLVAEFAPRVAGALAERDRLQAELDGWHRAHPGEACAADYVSFLRDVGYLRPQPAPVTVAGSPVTPQEFATVCGPQLVVPVTNARYALNAVNARWGSLYDALYGSDAVVPLPVQAAFDPVRADAVVSFARERLDGAFALRAGSFADVAEFAVDAGTLRVTLGDGRRTGLADPSAFRGYRGDPSAPDAVLLRRHGLHAQLHLDRSTPVGARDAAGLSDVVIESALTVILDLEDSVAVVDAADKAEAYRHWWGLCRGDLEASFTKDGRLVRRVLAQNSSWRSADGDELDLPGRAEMLVRVVGLHMQTDAVRTADGSAISETVLDTAVAVLLATRGAGAQPRKLLPVVVPKLHGADEVGLVVDLLARVERLLGLDEGMLALGLMDEERRTSANLSACIAAAASRLIFINTGFLDRSGDEIHSVMAAGPVMPKADLRAATWMAAYEQRNVQFGLRAGLGGRGQIGKGMWAMPDRMARMLDEKAAHARAGASTAWVPSPTAATLHALHYWDTDVAARQHDLGRQVADDVESLARLLTPPVRSNAPWTAEEIRDALDENAQSILGYVVRWVDAGVGCSTVPDLRGVGLMEDRATLRISSQFLANWLHHGVVSEDEVEQALVRMAGVVDAQNRVDPSYRAMSTDLSESLAFQAARELVFGGVARPQGYTEPVLHAYRRRAKADALRVFAGGVDQPVPGSFSAT